MSARATVVCDNPSCNAEKKEVNAWYKIISQRPYLVVTPAESSTAISLPSEFERAIYDACGESCVSVIVSKILGVWRS